MNNSIITRALSYVFSLCISLAFIYHFIPSITNRRVIFVFFILLTTITIGYALRNLFKQFFDSKHLHASKRRNLIVSIIFSFSILLMIPFNVDNYHTLKVQPLGEKNNQSLGIEVWVKEIKIDNRILPLNEMNLIGDWELINGVPVYTHGDNVLINWEGKVKSNISLKLSNHPYSGKVRLVIDGEENDYDLYGTNDDSTKEIHLDNLKGASIFEKCLVFLADLILLSFTIFIFLTRITIQRTPKSLSIGKGDSAVFLVPIIISWSIYFLSYYPGLMSGDSLDQWRQLSTFEFGDAHPIYDTLFKLLITKIWYSPAAIVLAQMMFLLSALLYGFRSLLKFEVNRKILWGMSILFSLIPVNSMMIISIWKDVTYSISLFLLTIVLINLYAGKEQWFKSKKNLFLLALSFFLVLMFRHNGIISVIGTQFLLLVFYKSKWKKIALIGITVLVLFFGIKSVLVKVLDIVPSPSILTFNIPIQQVASILSSGVKLDEEQNQVIKKAMDPKIWISEYNPYVVDPIIFNSNFDMLIFNDQKYKVQFMKVWFELIAKEPKIAIKSWLQQTSVVWRISQPSNSSTLFTERGIVHTGREYLDKYKLKTESLIPDSLVRIQAFLDRTQESDLVWLLWRPALYIFISMLFGLIFVFRNNLRSLIIFSPVMLNVIGLFAAIPAQQIRYLYPSILCTFIIIPLCFSNINEKR
ncbi:DUF6020 family protein [Paenibacillus sp. CMAA1739]|uniref:DUF6020 family protein n=3 Tax=Paenibacillus ottowii TaxID=2315729 RepID=UPI002731565C|nr:MULTISPECIES: DUF6020 family protein [Paenibacillus]MDP1510163.1 DUF6020 family protein [Paenibacillus ottowii]MEC4565579.1 DUF6020 family protein [Paenibacillus sp. CMAA1739]